MNHQREDWYDTDIEKILESSTTVPEEKSMIEKLRGVKWVRRTIQWALLCALLYKASPYIGYLDHKTTQSAVSPDKKGQYIGLENMYETEDEETNTIIDMMTGYGNKQKVTALMRKYGYYDVFPLEKFARPDKALYETIRGMHMKYGSPYVTFDGFYNFLGFGEEYAALYTPNHRLHINNCDSVKVILQPRGNGQKKRQKDSSSSKTLIAIDDRQSYLHNKRIAELAHAKQMQRDGFIKLSAKVARDATFNKVKGNSYGKLYTTGGTFENEAHSVIAPELCEEFITSYISKVDTNDDHYRKIISSLYNGYFEKYQDKEEAKRWLKN